MRLAHWSRGPMFPVLLSGSATLGKSPLLTQFLHLLIMVLSSLER